MTLIVHQGLSPWAMSAVIVAAVLTFLALTMVTKIIKGEESIIYYHHEIAVLVVAAVLLRALRQPVLPYLDVTVLGVGLFLACGRVGCLMVGCCHGRPHAWGVCYRDEHADAGFPHYLVGIRLFPVQLLESLWVFAAVAVGCWFVLSGRPPGEALGWYVVAYGLERFCVEFLRGDAARPYLAGFSEAQWTSLVLMAFLVAAELRGVLPFHPWHAVATGCLPVSMFGIALKRRIEKTARHQLLHPRHIREVAEMFERLSCLKVEDVPVSNRARPEDIPVGFTSLGVRISVGRIPDGQGWLYHYALSSSDGDMNEETAHMLARLIIRLRHPSSSYQLIQGQVPVFHVLILPGEPGGSKERNPSTTAMEEGCHAV